MQRDLKIGLSLAVLLIGVVGALFFRRDDTDSVDIPELKMAWEIDQQIMQRKGNHIPYMVDSKPPQAPAAEIVQASEPREEVITPASVAPTTAPQSTLTHSTESIAAREPQTYPPTPSVEVTDVLPPTPQDIYSDDHFIDSEFADATDAPSDPKPVDRDIDTPVARTINPRIETVDADRSQVIPKRWSNARSTNTRDNQIASAPRNDGWKSLEAKEVPVQDEAPIRDLTPSQGRANPKSLPLPPVADVGNHAEPPAPMATRKLKPIPITESNRFSRPEKTPFTTPREDVRTSNARTTLVDRTQASTGGQIYEVQSGDTLERIAYKHYGRRDKVEAILEANSDILSDPNRISIGMKLLLP